MTRIDQTFARLKKQGRKGLIAYITAGDPDLETTRELVDAFAQAGVDLIELGIPFSDPLADGLVNQLAAERALKSGTTVKKILGEVAKIRVKTGIPIVLFSYLNPMLKYGLKRFARDAKRAGVDGILALDLPVDEAGPYRDIMKRAALDTIFLIAPTSSDKRIKAIAHASSGFIYCVSRTGVTGMQRDMPPDIPEMILKVRGASRLPLALGFGVSSPAQAASFSSLCDAVVVGSAIVKKIAEHAKSGNLIKRVAAFVGELAQAVHAGKTGGSREILTRDARPE